MLAEADNVARLIAVIAVVVAAGAGCGTWAQARGQRAALAPKVSAWTANSGTHGNVTFKFETDLKIRKAVVKIRPDSSVSAIGGPKGIVPIGTKVRFDDVPSRGELNVPATFVAETAGNQSARFTVRMHGAGFGPVSVKVDAPSHNVYFYVSK